jgi:hypothetical protein
MAQDEVVWDDDQEGVKWDDERSSVLSDIGRGASRAAGVALGVANAPLAAVWGSLTPAETDAEKEEFANLSLPQKMAVRIGSGLESARASVFDEGTFGKDYGSYYKAVTGEEVNPYAQLAVNVISDPLIIGGVTKGLARGGFRGLRDLSQYIKSGKTPMPEAVYDQLGKVPSTMMDDVGRLNALEEHEAQATRQTLIDALNKRKADAEWYENWGNKQLDEYEKTQGFADRWATEEGLSDIQKSAREQGLDYRLGYTDKGRIPPPPPSVEVRSGIELREPYKTEYSLAEQAKRLKSKDTTLDYSGWNPAKTEEMQAVAGGALGFEDENGEVTFDPKKAVAGVAGGVVLTKMLKNKKLQGELTKAPEMRKVFESIVEEKPSFSMAGIVPKINEFIFNRFAPIKDVSRSTYDKALTYQSHKDVAWMKFQELQEKMKPVSDAEDLMTGYVAAKRMGTRAERGFKNPNNVSLVEAQKSVKQIEDTYIQRGGNVEDLRKAADDFNEWTRKNILQEARDSGLLSKDAYDKIIKDNDFYATFKILEKIPDDINKIAPSGGEYFSVGQQGVIKALKGTERKMDDPIAATIEKFVQAQSVFERNRVVSSLIDDPNTKSLLMPVAKSQKEYAILQKQGLNPIMEGSWSPRDFDTINRFKDGKVEKYLAPKEISEAMKRLTPWQAWKGIQTANTVFRKSATTLYLPFTISNAMRDALMAYNTSPVYTGALDIFKFGKDWARGAKEGFKYEFLGDSDLTRQYLKAGGGFGYSGEVRNARAAKKHLFDNKIDVINHPSDMVKIVKKIPDTIEKLSGAIELAPRLGVYSRAFEEFGTSATEAARLARSSTIDFSKGGVYTKALNQFVPFINARVQAWNNVRLALQKNPGATATKLFTSVVIPGVTAYAINRYYNSDLYDDIPRYVRDNYFTLITGSEQDEKGKTVPRYVVIPKGDVGQLIMNPIEYSMDQAMSKDRDSVGKFITNWMSDLSPVPVAREGELSASKALGSLTPPILKGVVENIANKNLYTGQDVVPYSMQKKPPELQYKENTPPSYKWLGEKTGISPLRIQNFMQNLFAGYGREGLDPASMVKGLTGRFVKTQGGEKESQAWDVVREVDTGYNHVRERAKDLIKKNKDDEAMELMAQWNESLVTNIAKLEKYGYEDQGGLYRDYIFSRKKMKNVMSGKELVRGIENKLAKKKQYKSR